MKEQLVQKASLIDGGTAVGGGIVVILSPYLPWMISVLTIIVLGYRVYLSHQQAKINRIILKGKNVK